MIRHEFWARSSVVFDDVFADGAPLLLIMDDVYRDDVRTLQLLPLFREPRTWGGRSQAVGQ